jgi:predicted RNA-binding protein
MCQMKVMLEKDDQSEELVMESASLLEVNDAGVRINSLFDPPLVLPGLKVVKIDFLDGKVLLAGR